MTSSSNWLLNWVLAYSTPYMVNPGKGNADLESKVFFIWGALCMGAAVFVYFCVHETKGELAIHTSITILTITGLSLEQVDELYEKVPHAWNSAGFVPSVSFAEVRQHMHEEKAEKIENEVAVVEYQ
jgi:hypothetical protein